jgi:hypothetical protein
MGRNRTYLVRVLAVFSAPVFSFVNASPVSANVNKCQVMHLYASALYSGRCVHISPTTQTLWVCDLPQATDVHTTFNLHTAFHLTLRLRNCEDNTEFGGTWPSHLTVQKQRMCNMNVHQYVDQLNAVHVLEKNAKSAFTKAVKDGKFHNPGEGQGWINLAEREGCNKP